MAKKRTEAEKQYQKELRRLQRWVQSAEARGYVFPSGSPIPQAPKEITQASVRRLQKITPESLYRKVKYLDQATGKLVSGTQGQALEAKARREKSQAARKAKKAAAQANWEKENALIEPSILEEPAKPEPRVDTRTDVYIPDETHIIITNFLGTLQHFPEGKGKRAMLAWFDKLIADNGRENFAEMLKQASQAGITLTWEALYNGSVRQTYLDETIKYMPDQGEIYADQIREYMEEFEDWETPE